MRILADENFPKRVVRFFRESGHDVIWVREGYTGWSDASLLDLAESERRIVVTLDKDFVEIALHRREPLAHSGVVRFQVHPATVANLLPLAKVLDRDNDRWSGLVSTIRPNEVEQFKPRGGPA